MSDYRNIVELENNLRSNNLKEFAREHEIAEELFNLYLEAQSIVAQKWILQPEKVGTQGLINRIFNDLHSGFKLLMEGLFIQGMSFLRDTIECSIYLRLFEIDTKIRDEWLSGKEFKVYKLRNMLKARGGSLPPQDSLYSKLCGYYVHPTINSIKPHILNWYPDNTNEHYLVFQFGGIEDVPRIKVLASALLGFTYVTIDHLFRGLFPIDKSQYVTWNDRMDSIPSKLSLTSQEADKLWLKHLSEQLTTMQGILNDRFRDGSIE